MFFFQCGNFFLENGQNKSEMYELSVMTTKMAIIERWELGVVLYLFQTCILIRSFIL